VVLVAQKPERGPVENRLGVGAFPEVFSVEDRDLKARRVEMNKLLKSELGYCNQFLNTRATNKLVANATSLKPSEKGSNRQSMIEYLPYGENVVKIGPVDLEFFAHKKGLF